MPLKRTAAALCAGCLLLAPWRGGATQLRVLATDPGEAAAWTSRVDALISSGDLERRQLRVDTLLPGRQHERLTQKIDGVPIFGAEIVRQFRGGEVVSVYGSLHENVEVATSPGLSAAEAQAIGEHETGVVLGPSRAPRLVVLPVDGSYVLTYELRTLTGSGVELLHIDASTGDIVRRVSDLKTQAPIPPPGENAAVGEGRGVHGDTKKVSTESGSSAFTTVDRLRPPAIRTYDLEGNLSRALLFLNGLIPENGMPLATDADNNWTDGANVDAHVYAGWTYDYLFDRFGRRGLDDADMPIISLVHPVNREDLFFHNDLIIDLFYLNAFYFGDGIIVYGEGLPEDVTTTDGRHWTYFSAAIDVVAHELTHGVTDFSSRLIYQNESGALNEAFSDIIGASVEFAFQPPGNGTLRADYLLGEDIVSAGAVRSMSNPLQYGDPDHYSERFLGSGDNGGVHINSGIANHAFYLAIEGGTHRLSGVTVAGVGGARRADIERAFYRAFVFLLPPDALFVTARQTTIQSAREIFGAGSDVETAIRDAWTAVGVE